MTTDRFETVIGLEVHVQLDTRTKLFCPCRNTFGEPPNSQICPVCYGLPGALPVPNLRAVELAVVAALALDCEVEPESIFERKNYFYPDLPKGYQITQYDRPIARRGGVRIQVGDASPRIIRIHRIQLEEDAGKLVHDGYRGSEEGSGVDFNRAGVPLIEIVSEPDLRSAAEAGDYARTLRQRIVHAGVSDADMEKGNLRMDGNISIRRRGDAALGAKVELKNLNSFRYLERALAYEEVRQRRILRSGGVVVQETRLFDEGQGRSFAMRSKEEAADYRYFPDPDLPPLRLPPGLVESARAGLPEFPTDRAARFVRDYGIPEDAAHQIAARRGLASYFETVVEAAAGSGTPARDVAPVAAAFLTTDVVAREKQDGGFRAPPRPLGQLMARLADGRLPRNAVRDLFNALADRGEDAPELDALIAELGFDHFAGGDRLERAAAEVVAAYPDEAAAYRSGRKKVIGFLMGRLLRELRGKADARAARSALERVLEGAPDSSTA